MIKEENENVDNKDSEKEEPTLADDLKKEFEDSNDWDFRGTLNTIVDLFPDTEETIITLRWVFTTNVISASIQKKIKNRSLYSFFDFLSEIDSFLKTKIEKKKELTDYLENKYKKEEFILNINKKLAKKLNISEICYIKLVEKKKLTLFHGTKPQHVKNILAKGLESSSGYSSAKWYMLSSDYQSALYHASTDSNLEDFVYVIEFEIPVNEKLGKWAGYPYVWKPSIRNEKSSWYALRKPIPKNFIKKVHKITYNDWLKQKQKGF